MIAIVVDVFLLQRNVWVMVVEKAGSPLFEHRYALTMDAGSVKQESRAGWSRQFHYLRRMHIVQLAVLYQARMLFTMTALDVIECSAADIGEIDGQLNFFVNLHGYRLIVPRVSVPAVKILLCW